ncbi:hypothetical protein T09_9690 [Trichinella sp. T9]|nr:hypothetical protein T09_9690 [Trichinella sp. T9]
MGPFCLTARSISNTLLERIPIKSSNDTDVPKSPLALSCSMKEKSSANDSRLEAVMGLRGSRLLCCMSNAYFHRLIQRSKFPESAYTAPR